jgi:hypothetical protein
MDSETLSEYGIARSKFASATIEVATEAIVVSWQMGTKLNKRI